MPFVGGRSFHQRLPTISVWVILLASGVSVSNSSFPDDISRLSLRPESALAMNENKDDDEGEDEVEGEEEEDEQGDDETVAPAELDGSCAGLTPSACSLTI